MSETTVLGGGFFPPPPPPTAPVTSPGPPPVVVPVVTTKPPAKMTPAQALVALVLLVGGAAATYVPRWWQGIGAGTRANTTALTKQADSIKALQDSVKAADARNQAAIDQSSTKTATRLDAIDSTLKGLSDSRDASASVVESLKAGTADLATAINKQADDLKSARSESATALSALTGRLDILSRRPPPVVTVPPVQTPPPPPVPSKVATPLVAPLYAVLAYSPDPNDPGRQAIKAVIEDRNLATRLFSLGVNWVPIDYASPQIDKFGVRAWLGSPTQPSIVVYDTSRQLYDADARPATLDTSAIPVPTTSDGVVALFQRLLGR